MLISCEHTPERRARPPWVIPHRPFCGRYFPGKLRLRGRGVKAGGLYELVDELVSNYSGFVWVTGLEMRNRLATSCTSRAAQALLCGAVCDSRRSPASRSAFETSAANAGSFSLPV